MIFDPALNGIWNDKGSNNPCAFTEAGDKKYKLLCVNESNKKDEFTVHLLKLNNQLYLDILPQKCDSQEMNLLKHWHFFAQIRQQDNTIQMSLINTEWLQKLLKDSPSTISCQKVNKESIFLTAQTKELQVFIIKHANTRGAWYKGDLLTRQLDKVK